MFVHFLFLGFLWLEKALTEQSTELHTSISTQQQTLHALTGALSSVSAALDQRQTALRSVCLEFVALFAVNGAVCGPTFFLMYLIHREVDAALRTQRATESELSAVQREHNQLKATQSFTVFLASHRSLTRAYVLIAERHRISYSPKAAALRAGAPFTFFCALSLAHHTHVLIASSFVVNFSHHQSVGGGARAVRTHQRSAQSRRSHHSAGAVRCSPPTQSALDSDPTRKVSHSLLLSSCVVFVL
jgi:hypothetical protein